MYGRIVYAPIRTGVYPYGRIAYVPYVRA